jgi:hypothetical protein
MAQRGDAKCRSETGAPAEVTNNIGRHGRGQRAVLTKVRLPLNLLDNICRLPG